MKRLMCELQVTEVHHTLLCFSLTAAISFLELRGTLVLISRMSNFASLHEWAIKTTCWLQ